MSPGEKYAAWRSKKGNKLCEWSRAMERVKKVAAMYNGFTLVPTIFALITRSLVRLS